jgi:hypothetical protein
MSEQNREPGWPDKEPGTGTADDFERRRQEAEDRTLEYAEGAKAKAGEYAEKARDQVEAGREQAASSMNRMADAVRERTADSSGVAGQAGAKVAESMESAAGYLREHNTSDIWSDVESYAKGHPGKALAGAVVAGFLMGRLLR